LQRATPINVHVGAAATVVTYSLDASLSPPVHRIACENSKQGLTPT
jgi:hypothetical protein